MKIGIVPRADLKEALNFTKKIMDTLSTEEFVLPPNVAKKFGEKGTSIEKMDVESLVTVGGDGTVLYTLQKSQKPILGINMGGRGFLADVNPDEALKAIKRLSKKELELIERKRLAVEISGERLANALNEGVIRSKKPSRVLSFKIFVDDEEVEKTRGDGLIVATPTGSTAYARAAGGPIIDQNLGAYVVVPLSIHRSKTMPLVYPMSSELKVELLEPGRKADITVDGQITEVAEQNDIISFKEAKNGAKFFRWKGGFYEKIREKL